MSHSFHGMDYDIHRDGLADNCDRCSYHAKWLHSLDGRMLAALDSRIANDQMGRSENERIALANRKREIQGALRTHHSAVRAKRWGL